MGYRQAVRQRFWYPSLQKVRILLPHPLKYYCYGEVESGQILRTVNPPPTASKVSILSHHHHFFKKGSVAQSVEQRLKNPCRQFDSVSNHHFLIFITCAGCGGIGRRAGLKIPFRFRINEFDSHHSHHCKISLIFLQYLNHLANFTNHFR